VICSSRRRHTRSKRDWSSDVCSSDLNELDLLEYKEDESRPNKDDLQQLESLVFDSHEKEEGEAVRNLEGIEYATNLEELIINRKIGRASCRERGGIEEAGGAGDGGDR